MPETLLDSVQTIASRHGIETDQLTSSIGQAAVYLAELRVVLLQQFPPDAFPGIDVVVSGSIAKRQCTRGSDVDFFGVAERPLPPGDAERIIRAILEKATAMGLDTPFAQGSNGTFVPGSELEQINIVKDDIRAAFRRMALVTGSVSVYRPELRAKIVRAVLSGFVGRDRTPRVRGVFDHFLYMVRVSNMVSEWRMNDRSSDGGFVGWAKSVTLHRVDYAASIAAVIRASVQSEGRSREDLVEALAVQLDRPPLARLLAWYADFTPAGQAALAAVLQAVNDSLRLFATEGVRARLAAAADDEPTRAVRAAFEQPRARLNAAIVQMFFREPALAPWTEALGMFG